jgi:hypothetical protein
MDSGRMVVANAVGPERPQLVGLGRSLKSMPFGGARRSSMEVALFFVIGNVQAHGFRLSVRPASH